MQIQHNGCNRGQGFPNVLGERPQMGIMGFLQTQAMITLHLKKKKKVQIYNIGLL